MLPFLLGWLSDWLMVGGSRSARQVARPPADSIDWQRSRSYKAGACAQRHRRGSVQFAAHMGAPGFQAVEQQLHMRCSLIPDSPGLMDACSPGMGDFGVIEICSVIYGAHYAVRRHTP